MKVLFLDFDGVLNNFQSRNFGEEFNKSTCKNLNTLLEREPDLKVVVSSAWRHHGLAYCRDVLAKNGINRSKIIAITGFEPGIRGNQIQCWLDRMADDLDVTSFVIIDDENDMGDLTDRLVKTSSYIGLTSKHVDEAVEVLKKPRK